jgi:hypothetical protein
MEITVRIPEDLATQLRPLEAQLPQILELGLREWKARHGAGFNGLTGVLETLAALPAPEEVLALRPSPALQARISELLEKNRTTGLLPEERQEWERYQYVEHLVRLAKARATLLLKGG